MLVLLCSSKPYIYITNSAVAQAYVTWKLWSLISRNLGQQNIIIEENAVEVAHALRKCIQNGAIDWWYEDTTQ